MVSPAQGDVAPVGQDFVVTAGDLSFILKQIKISERHAHTFTADNPCGTLVGSAPNQIPDRLTPYGLRTTDGSCNNLFPGGEHFAAADQPFPRLTKPVFRDAEDSPAAFGPPHPTSYTQKKGNVFDSQPRVISNLIVDQTSTNPAAVAAAEFPVRTQGNPGVHPCTTDPAPDGTGGVPAGCVPSGKTLFITNVTTDVGLSPPYNSMFTFFGQFFDHGVDQTVKSGGTVFVPLKDDDKGIVASLERYVRQGGGLCVYVGDNTHADTYNRLLYREGAGLLPAPLADRPLEENVPIEEAVERISRHEPNLLVRDESTPADDLTGCFTFWVEEEGT